MNVGLMIKRLSVQLPTGLLSDGYYLDGTGVR